MKKRKEFSIELALGAKFISQLKTLICCALFFLVTFNTFVFLSLFSSANKHVATNSKLSIKIDDFDRGELSPYADNNYPEIVTQPSNIIVKVGGSDNRISVTIKNIAGQNIIYQWYLNKTQSFPDSNAQPISGETKASYSVSVAEPIEEYYVFVRVTNTALDNPGRDYINSRVCKVRVDPKNQKPIINEDLKETTYTVEKNEELNLLVQASSISYGTLGYQWFFSKTNEYKGDKIKDAINSSYKVPTDTAGEYYYYVEVASIVADTQDEVLNSKIAHVKVEGKNEPEPEPEPEISVEVTQSSDEIFINETVDFVAQATVVPSRQLYYRWYILDDNGTGSPIDYATQDEYTFTGQDEGTYKFYVKVSVGENSYSVDSDIVTVVVKQSNSTTPPASPKIKNTSNSTTVNIFENVNLFVEAEVDYGQLHYQWVLYDGLIELTNETEPELVWYVSSYTTQRFICRVTSSFEGRFSEPAISDIITINVFSDDGDGSNNGANPNPKEKNNTPWYALGACSVVLMTATLFLIIRKARH